MSNLRRIRIDKSMTIRKLADRSGVTYQAIQYLETPRRSRRNPEQTYPIPTLPNARMIARALGVSVNAIWPVAEEEK